MTTEEENKNRDARARLLLEILRPALRFTNRPEWSSPRANTEWGTKTKIGLEAVIKRVMFEAEGPEITQHFRTLDVPQTT